MTATLERPPTAVAPGPTDGGTAGPPGRHAMGVASVLARVAPAVPDPRAHHRRRGRHHRGLGRCHQHPPPKDAGFGTARYSAGLHCLRRPHGEPPSPGWSTLGPVDVIENETLAVPGSINTYQLRAQNPHGPFGGRCSRSSPGAIRPVPTRWP